MNRRKILAGMLAAAAIPITGCGEENEEPTPSPSPTPGGTGGDIQVLQSSLARVAATPAAARKAAGALNRFAFDLYGEIGGASENTVFSPYSVAIALAMTRNGAAGQTLSEMTATLHAGDGYDESMNALDQALISRAGEYRSGDQTLELELRTANQLWGQHGYPFHQEFLDGLARNYGAGLRLVDFIADTEGSRQAINGWVSDQTRERIPELIAEGVITRVTRLVLTNAVYLKAPWMRPFVESLTAKAPFRLLDGGTSNAEFMRLDGRLGYATAPGYEAVELPYIDGSLSMLVVVPDEGEFEAFRRSFDAAALDRVVAGLGETQVDLRFPKFEYRTQAGLKDMLVRLGMPTPFEPGVADFSAMSPDGKNLFISAVIHEAFVSVDEKGTEAAAATAVIIDRTSGPPRFVELTVDRPFIYLIRDRETGATLFLGHVVDPAK